MNNVNKYEIGSILQSKTNDKDTIQITGINTSNNKVHYYINNSNSIFYTKDILDRNFTFLSNIHNNYANRKFENVNNIYGSIKTTCSVCGDIVMVSPARFKVEKYCSMCGSKFI